ncbi:helix-turn-helix domain-containing protein [Bacteroides mediterraneensis]|nr:helix-turn-helix domain-containing protein [Bacteroides mediterraneensis]CDD51102.1 putative uncharacterized protein [Bacteroides sp. CAG:875]
MNKVITEKDERITALYCKLHKATQNMELIINNKLSILSGHRYLTDAELAKCLKISRRTLQEYRNNGIIPFYHVGGKILYKEADIEEFLETNRQEAIE